MDFKAMYASLQRKVDSLEDRLRKTEKRNGLLKGKLHTANEEKGAAVADARSARKQLENLERLRATLASGSSTAGADEDGKDRVKAWTEALEVMREDFRKQMSEQAERMRHQMKDVGRELEKNTTEVRGRTRCPQECCLPSS